LTDLTKVSGIGPATAKLLKQHGIATAESLAQVSLETLISVPGFSETRAGAILEATEACLETASPSVTASTANTSHSDAGTEEKMIKVKSKVKKKKARKKEPAKTKKERKKETEGKDKKSKKKENGKSSNKKKKKQSGKGKKETKKELEKNSKKDKKRKKKNKPKGKTKDKKNKK
jgi:hypothetical protein